MKIKLNKDNGLHARWTRTPSGNSVLPQLAVTWFPCNYSDEHSASHQLLCYVDNFVLPFLPAGRVIRHFDKRQNVSYVYELGAFIGQGEKEKARHVFQHMLQLQQWGAFGYIAPELEMKRL